MSRSKQQTLQVLKSLADVSELSRSERLNVPDYSTEYIMWTRLEIDADCLHAGILCRQQHTDFDSLSKTIRESLARAGLVTDGRSLDELAAQAAATIEAQRHAIERLRRRRKAKSSK